MTRPALWLAVLAAGLALAVPASAGATRIGGSVVGGAETSVEQWPFITALVVNGEPADRGQFCGGSVADATHVITAAHCVEGSKAGDVDVVVGRSRLAGSDGQRVRAAAIAVQPAYDSEGSGHDIAVLTLAEPVSAPPVVTAGADDLALGAAGVLARLAGWGLVSQSPPTAPTVLQQAAITIVGPNRCRKAYGTDVFDTALMICAGTPDVGPPDSCSGDSGGPLVADGPLGSRLVGIVSFGSDVCGDPGAPAAYTRVSSETAFIAAQLGGAPPPLPNPVPRTSDLRPRVEIGRIWCSARCYVEVGASGAGAEAVPGLVVRVRRARRGSRKGVDRSYPAKRLSSTRWRAKVGLPFGRLRVSARAVDESLQTIGTTDRVSLVVEPD